MEVNTDRTCQFQGTTSATFCMAPGACPVNLPFRSSDLQLPSRHHVSHPTTTHLHQDHGGTPALHLHNHWFWDVALTRILPGKADCQSAFCTGNSADLHPCSACSWTWQTKKTNKQETHCRWEMRTAPYTLFILFYYLSLLFLSICTISSNEPGFSPTIL